MRLLHVVPTYYPAIRYGGTITAVHDLTRGLVKNGHHVEVFTTNIDGPARSAVPLQRLVALDGVNITYFSAEYFPRLYFSPSMGRALRKRAAEFDVLMLHSVYTWPTLVAAQAARRAGVPYVVTPHGMLVKELIAARHPLIKRAWLRLFERSTYESASAIRVTSEVERVELERFGWQIPKVFSIPNPVTDPQTYAIGDVSSDVLEICTYQPFVLFFGRISWKKGIERLLESLLHTARGRLVIVGNDDENLTPELRMVAERLGVASRVIFLPRTVSGADKEHLFRTADLFALTSYNENFGNTVAEAMRRRLPVITIPEVGASEIVRKSGAGLVVQGTPKLIGEAVDRLLADEELRHTMGLAGETFTREKCNNEKIARQVDAELSSVLRHTPRHSMVTRE